MKTEIRKEVINHPEFGKLTKEFKYTYDEKKYSSLDECLADHKKAEEEKDAEAKLITDENKQEISRVGKENEELAVKFREEFNSGLKKWEDSLSSIQSEYEKKIADLQKEYSEKYAAETKLKPQQKYSELKKPVLKKIDISKYEGRGYISKEFHVVQSPVDVVSILNSATPEEIEKIKELLK